MVIAIIGVLIAIVLPVLRSTIHRSREVACLANMREANAIATAWSFDNRDLPPHFETSPFYTDALGVPQMQMRVGDVTFSQPYFDQTFLWIRALVAPDRAPPRALTCTGLEQRTPVDGVDAVHTNASTTYHLSSALLADASVFTPEAMADYETSVFAPQALTKAAFPSTKAFLSEQTVFHLDGDGRPTEELRTPAAPVAFIDGHASVVVFTEAVHEPIAADATSSQAFMHTVRGVLGWDIE